MNTITTYSHQPWNKGKLVGQKAPLRLRDIWAWVKVIGLDPAMYGTHTMRRTKASLIYHPRYRAVTSSPVIRKKI